MRLYPTRKFTCKPITVLLVLAEMRRMSQRQRTLLPKKQGSPAYQHQFSNIKFAQQHEESQVRPAQIVACIRGQELRI